MDHSLPRAEDPEVQQHEDGLGEQQGAPRNGGHQGQGVGVGEQVQGAGVRAPWARGQCGRGGGRGQPQLTQRGREGTSYLPPQGVSRPWMPLSNQRGVPAYRGVATVLSPRFPRMTQANPHQQGVQRGAQSRRARGVVYHLSPGGRGASTPRPMYSSHPQMQYQGYSDPGYGYQDSWDDCYQNPAPASSSYPENLAFISQHPLQPQ